MKTRLRKRLPGFTIVELMIVMTTIAILLGLVSINLITVQDKANLSTTINTLTADMRTQQLKAMVGETDGTGSPGRYGLHIDQNSYTLFYGSVYNASQSGNITVDLPETVEFTNVSLPNSQVIFEKGNGEIVGFVPSEHSFSLINTSSNEEHDVEFNRYGVITKGP